MKKGNENTIRISKGVENRNSTRMVRLVADYSFLKIIYFSVRLGIRPPFNFNLTLKLFTIIFFRK